MPEPVTAERAPKLMGSLVRIIRGQMVLEIGADLHVEMWEGGGNLEWGLKAHKEKRVTTQGCGVTAEMEDPLHPWGLIK